MSSDGRGLRLLSLDGGGIRGVSELLILHEVMARIQHKQKLPELPRPHMYFDIIGGTSTGGLIAIMLGRLRMSTQEAIDEYVDLAEHIFKEKKFKTQDGLFKATRLKEATQKIINKYGGHDDPEEEMMDIRDDSTCKTFVCAVAAEHVGSPTIFRSYKVPRTDINCKIWEAARATSAAPTFFKRIKIGKKNDQVHFVDAALGCNNPVRQVLNEAELACENVPIHCILSVGTGKPQTVGLPKPDAFQKLLPTKIIEVLKKLATDSDRVAEEMEQQYKNTPGKYFRLNVEQGMQGITLEEWKKLGEVRAHTMQYLRRVRVSKEVDDLVNALTGEHVSSGVLFSEPIGPSAPGQVKSSATKYWKVPHSRSPAFTGRQEILLRLQNYVFNKDTRLSRHVFVLYGLGGSGKTQIALSFCETHRDRFWGVFWVDATSEDTAEASFRGIAKILQTEASSDAVKEYLSTSEEEWLLVIDNVDDPDLDVSNYFPPGNRGNILITSRNPETCAHAPVLDAHNEVDKMEPEEAISLILKVSRQDPTDQALRVDARPVVNELGFLALAIDRAGSYIAVRKCTLKEYLGLFQKRRKSLLEKRISKQNSSSYERTVYTTWEISFQVVQQKNSLASDILQIFSYLHYDQIPREIFGRASDKERRWQDVNDVAETQWTASRVTKPILDMLEARQDEEWDGDNFDLAIDILQSFSLVKREKYEDEIVYSLHPLVHWFTRDRLADEDQLQFKQSVVCLLNRSIQSTFGESESDLRFQRGLHVHVESCRKLFPELFTCIQIQQPEVLVEVDNLTIVYQIVGAWKQAAELRVQVLEATKRALGAEHSNTLTSMTNLASTYMDQGRLEEAEQLGVQVMEARKRVLGAEHPDILTIMGNLALTYSDQGRLEEAEQLEVQVMEARKRVLGAEHPDTLTIMDNLALTYKGQGRLGEAEQLEVQVMEARKRVLGTKHPCTLRSMNNYAYTLKDLGQASEPIELMTKAVALRSKIIGEDHPHTKDSRSTLAGWMAESDNV